MQRLLFVCSQNKLRSPTAENIFCDRPEIEVSSAGTNHDAENPLSGDQIEWADTIFVMEKTHKNKIQKKYRSQLKDKRVVCLGIPDEFEYMDPRLVSILETKMSIFLSSRR